MKKRILSMLLIFAVLIVSVPALAAEGGVNILTKDGPVWVGTQREADTLRLVWSGDQGKSWYLADGYVYDTGITEIQDIQYTGRDYFLTGYQCKFAYTSDDGKFWTQMKIINQPWFEENAGYITNDLCSGTYQLLWTGTEYLMRQSIQGDPRGTHNMRPPNPRNKLVTVLDENYNILSSVAFDGEVTAIRYENGTGYAAVGGVEHSFTRADWENNFEGPGILYRRFYSDGTVILQQEVNGQWMGRGRCSYDGVNWTPVPDGEEVSFSMAVSRSANPVFVPTGRGFFQIGAYQSDCRATVDGLHWFNVGEKEWLLESADCWTNVSMEGRRDLQFVWSGAEYLVCQDVALIGPEGQTESAANTKVFFLDENYDLVRQYDFGSKVLQIGYNGGTCYAQVQIIDMDSGLPVTVVFASGDGERWEKTDLESIPAETGSFKKTPLEGDMYAGGYVLRLEESGRLVVSDDGVYFTPLDTIPAYQGIVPVPYGRMEAYPGRDGVQLCLKAVGGDGSSVLDEKNVSYTKADIDAAIAAAFPGDRCYATLDGAYISFDDPPYAKNQRVMVPLRNISEALGFTVEWVREEGRDLAVCARDGVVIQVEIGSAAATVNGKPCILEAPSEVLHDRTYVPIRFFSEQFGLDVDWDQAAYTVLLATPE